MVSKNMISNFKNFDFFAVVIIGPTASGKSDLSHDLFHQLKQRGVEAELVNLDAFQLYRSVTLGTAKPTLLEQKIYSYHGIDVLNYDSSIDAVQYAQMAHRWCEDIWKRNKLPICVGGSGLYQRAFLHGLDDLPQADYHFREELRKIAESQGWSYLHEELKKVDMQRALELHPNDKTRIERALEVYHLSKIPMSQWKTKNKVLAEQKTLFSSYCVQMHVGQNGKLTDELKNRIKNRTKTLLENGWIDEVKDFLKRNNPNELFALQSFKAIGYSQVLNYVVEREKTRTSGDNSENQKILYKKLLEEISTSTWRYAKRQLTWNAKEKCDVKVECGQKLTEKQIEQIVQLFTENQKLTEILIR